MKRKTLFIAVLMIIPVLLVATAAPHPVSAQSTLPPLCSGFQLQNPSQTSSVTNIQVDFYQVEGGTGTPAYSFSLPDIAANSSAAFYVPSYSGFSTVPSGQYSLIVNSGAPLNAIVNQRTCSGSPYVVSSYTGINENNVGTTVNLPYVLSRAFTQNYSSAITVQNTGSSDTNVTLNFYQPGSSTAITPIPTHLIKAGESWYVDLSAGTYAVPALNGFAGSATVTSASQTIAVVVTYGEGAGDNLLTYTGLLPSFGSQKLYATQVDKFAYSQQYVSGITLYNPNGSSTPVNIDYIPSGSTTPVYTMPVTIPANSSYIQYLGSIDQIPNGFNGAAVVTVTSGSNKIFGIFNIRSTSGQADAMYMIPQEVADTTLYMPQVVRNYSGGYNSGWQIVNTSSNTLSISVEYWKVGSTSPSYTQPITLGPNSAQVAYLGNSEFSPLGDNWNGSAIVKVTGGSGAVIASVNLRAPGDGDTLSQYVAFNSNP